MKKHYGENAPYKTLGAFRRESRKQADEQSPAMRKWKHRRADENQFERWKKVKGFRNCPETLDKLQEIKYNDSEEWERLKRERKTLSDIQEKPWTDTFREKAIKTYYEFREHGVEFTDHGVARFLSRMTKEDFWKIHTQPFNYVQDDGRMIKYYGNQAIIYLPDTKEIVSVIVNRRTAKEGWNEL